MRKVYYVFLLFFCFIGQIHAGFSDVFEQIRMGIKVYQESINCPDGYIFLKEVALYALFVNHPDFYRGKALGHWFVKKDIESLQVCQELTPPGYVFNESAAHEILTSERECSFSMYTKIEREVFVVEKKYVCKEIFLSCCPWQLKEE